MQDWLDFGTCFEVDDDRIERALAPATTMDDALPRDRVFALLDRMAQVARPRQGGPRVLFVLARLATCDWLDGDLRVSVASDGSRTTIELMVFDGLVTTRLRPSVDMDVPFGEMELGVDRIAEWLAPLSVSERVPGRRFDLAVQYDDEGAEEASDRPTARPPAEVATMGVHKLARRTEPPKRPSRVPPPISEFPRDSLFDCAEVEPDEAQVTREPKKGWGKPPAPKPTVKMEAVRIPTEAYRDEMATPVRTLDHLPDLEDDVATVKPPAPVTGVDEGSPPTEDIDEEW